MSRLPRVVGQERHAEHDLGDRRGRVFPEIAPEHRERLRAAWSDEQPAEERQQLRRDHHQHRRQPVPAGAGQDRPGRHQHQQQRRRDQASPQVVEDLPAPDHRQRVALDPVARRHEGEEPGEDLPVAADPPVLAARVREQARGVLVHELDVGHQRDARVEPLEQVVRQQDVLRRGVLERGHERVDVVEALAGEDAFAEQVLVGVGDRGRVGVDAGVAGIEAREQRPRRAREGDADPRLQDAVAVGDAPGLRIEGRAIERVRDDADQLPRRITRQARVAVERDAVAHLRQDRHVADMEPEAGVGGPAQQAVELLDLSPLALPSHPQAFLRVPLPRAVEQEELIGALGAVLGVERFDAGARRGQDLGIVRHRLGRRVAHVAQQREVDVRVDVAEGLDFQVGNQFVDALDAVEHRRHDHHGAGVGRDGHQFEPRQPPRRDQIADDPLHDLDRQLARRHGRQQRDPGQHRAAPAMLVGDGQGHGDQRAGAEDDRAEVAGRRVLEEQAADPDRAAGDSSRCPVRRPDGRGRSGSSRRGRLARSRNARPPDARVRRSSAPGAAARHRSVRQSPRPPDGSDRGSGSPSGRRRRPGRVAAPARPG